MTFYGLDDAGTITAYGQPTGGTGTYADPLTLAADASSTVFKPGTMVYVKALQRYFKVGDKCNACVGAQPTRIDGWIGSVPGDVSCSQQLMNIDMVGGGPSSAMATTPVIVDPANNLPVPQAFAMWDGTCHMPTPPYPTS